MICLKYVKLAKTRGRVMQNVTMRSVRYLRTYECTLPFNFHKNNCARYPLQHFFLSRKNIDSNFITAPGMTFAVNYGV